MDNKIFLYTVIVFVLMISASVYLFPAQKIVQSNSVREAPLVKNTKFALLDGERYVYLYNVSASNNSFIILYNIKKGINCTAIEIQGTLNRTFACVDQFGNDRTYNNYTLKDQFFYVFAPWMLAIDNTWNWSVESEYSLAMGSVITNRIDLISEGNDTTLGRSAYRIRLELGQGKTRQTFYRWIDQEKRVLLRETGPGYKIDLVQAPFNVSKE
ncbi:MAG: hypothetical protein AABX38_00340 [Candidatus Micrarchaeota archaeon]